MCSRMRGTEKGISEASPELSEKWVEVPVAADPSLIGLGDLVGRQKIVVGGNAADWAK